MGSPLKLSGSRLLGEELKRLRGDRSLSTVVELGQLRLSGSGFRGVSRATLSDIENGRVLPSVESLFSLSVLYQIPASRLLHVLLEENVLEQTQLPTDSSELRTEFSAAVTACEWPRALALAVHGCRTAVDAEEAIRWRLNRATAMQRLGMREDAIAELQRCLGSPTLPKGERYRVHRDLAQLNVMSSNAAMAEIHINECLRTIPADCPAAIKASVLLGKVQLHVLRDATGWPADAEAQREARLAIHEARQLLDSKVDSQLAVAADQYRAMLDILAGSVAEARLALLGVLTRCRATGYVYGEATTLRLLAKCEQDSAPARAREHLRTAADLSIDRGFIDEAFGALVQLAELAESTEQTVHYLRKAERLYPFMHALTPERAAFESLRFRVQA